MTAAQINDYLRRGGIGELLRGPSLPGKPGDKGDKGDALVGPPGPPNRLSIGTVTETSVPVVTISGTSPRQVLSFGLVRGPKGDPGGGDIDGGFPDSIYGGTTPIDGGTP